MTMIETFISNGSLPDLDKLNRNELEVLLVDIATVKRNASAMLRSKITKAAASSMIQRCEDAEKRISAAYKALQRR